MRTRRSQREDLHCHRDLRLRKTMFSTIKMQSDFEDFCYSLITSVDTNQFVWAGADGRVRP
jgi:hypothetical protein